MNDLMRDLRHATHRLRRSPGFTAVALATLALGIGTNTALFSLVHAVLLQPLPFSRPERLFAVHSRHASTDRYPFSLPEFCDYRDQSRTLLALAGAASWSGNLGGAGLAERIPGLRVTGNFFEMMGAGPQLGRLFVAADDQPGRERVVVLSHGLWHRRFGGDPGVVGRAVTLNGDAYTVVGVLGADFAFPLRDIDLAIPLAPEQDPWRHNRESTNFLRVLARARDGADAERITADLEEIGRRLQQEFPGTYARKKGVLVVPYREELTRNVSRPLFMLMAAVLLLLLIACANLANLMLVRATARRHELAVRRALGASPSLLARGLLLESLLLAGGGAALGVLLAHWAVPALVALSPTAMPRAQEIRLSTPVLAFTALVAAAAAAGFGLVPAWRARGVDPSRHLQGRGTGADADRGHARGLLVGAQAGVMVVLLVGAALLLQSFRAVMQVDAGFDPGVLTVRLSLPRMDYTDSPRISRFYEELEGRVLSLPGVEAVAATNHVPLNGAIASADYKVADRPPASETDVPTALYRMVTPEYFRAMGIPLLVGRAIGPDDREGRVAVGVISESLARQGFEGRDPVGRQLLVKDNPEGFRPIEIIGVVGDVRHGGLETPPEPHLYVPYHQVHKSLLVWLAQTQFLVVRAYGAPLSLGPAVRKAVQAVDPNVASAGGRLSGFYVETAAAARRFSLVLLAIFALTALVMASVGLYGVVSYAVERRTRETGLRLALGASRLAIVAMVLRDGLRRTAVGTGVGLVAALVAARSLRGLLFGVGAADPLTYAGVVVLLLTVSAAACLVPAWRAARLDPVEALRQD
jgi:predicted permease